MHICMQFLERIMLSKMINNLTYLPEKVVDFAKN